MEANRNNWTLWEDSLIFHVTVGLCLKWLFPWHSLLFKYQHYTRKHRGWWIKGSSEQLWVLQKAFMSLSNKALHLMGWCTVSGHWCRNLKSILIGNTGHLWPDTCLRLKDIFTHEHQRISGKCAKNPIQSLSAVAVIHSQRCVLAEGNATEFSWSGVQMTQDMMQKVLSGNRRVHEEWQQLIHTLACSPNFPSAVLTGGNLSRLSTVSSSHC